MYLKRLEMLGFKSFAARTLLEFSPGMTAVVGPNGAGKSNVADAIRWVLGEQSMRQLRGKKGEDIIFAGGHGKAALGMAEVSLTLDNSTGWVPSEYSEITVTRRSYRSGENEYLINKQKVRLRDVLLLLAQARIGHDSYTVVGQGLIDAALSLRAEERRGLFEDAAGIRPFQVQRNDADSRLRQTQQNLERLRDIVGEIEPRLEPLREQAQRAIEYKQVNTELQDVLLTWYALQWRRLQANQQRAEQAEQEQAANVRRLEQSVSAADERVTSLRHQRLSTQARLAEVRAAHSEVREAAQKLERELAVSEERIAGLEQQRVEQQQEERRLRERLVALQQQLIDLEEQCDLADEAVDVEASALAAFESQVTKAQREYEAEERRLRGAQNDLIQVQARLGASQSDLGRQQKHLGERNRLLAARRETIAQSQQTLRTLETRLVDERSRLELARGEEQQASQRRQALGRAIADAQQEMERLKAALSDAERQRRLVADRLNMLKNWRQSLSGYGDGVRALLRQVGQGDKVTGLVAPVPQLGVAPSGLEIALEAALGPYLQAVVVQNFDDARHNLAYVRDKKAGKAMLVWLDEGRTPDDIDDAQDQAEEAILQRYLDQMPALRERVIGFAWRHIQCEDRYVPLFRRVLRGIVIVKDDDAARQLLDWAMTIARSSRGDLPFVMIVTLYGEAFHTDGWISGGASKDGSQQGLLAYEREWHELPQQLSEHVALIDQINGMISAAQRGQEGRRAEQSALDKELQKLTSRVNELTRTLTATQREQERAQTEVQLSNSVEQQLVAEISGLEQEVLAAQERVRAHEKTQREMAGLVEEFQQEMEERAAVYRRQQDELGRKRTTLAVRRQEAKAQRQQFTLQQSQAQEVKAQLERHKAAMQEAELRQRTLSEDVAVRRTEIAETQARVQRLAEELASIEEQARNTEGEIAEVERQTLHLRNTLSEAESIYRRCLLESQKTRDAVEALLAQFNEEMGESDAEALATYATGAELALVSSENGVNGSSNHTETLSEEEEATLRKLRRRVDTLRSRLRALGGCDPDAPQQYEETKTRYEFLTTQITDMEQAILHLQAIIDQLDVTMARQFEETFRAVNVRFRQHFTTLFNGGEARLELVAAKENAEDEPMPSSRPAGVEIIVQPPGKKAQELSLLSGGERALVSAALLFSLLEINPPPFCLLDEVDAALDESNVVRFCDILKQLARNTQFIVITHNRVTMTEAQVIYGVSMGGDSVSRLLSLRLEEVPVGR